MRAAISEKSEEASLMASMMSHSICRSLIFACLLASALAGCRQINGLIFGTPFTEGPPLEEVCKPSECVHQEGGHFAFRHKEGANKVILFVHGFNSSANTGFDWWPYEYFHDADFAGGGFDVWAFNYETDLLKCSEDFKTLDRVGTQLEHFLLDHLRNTNNNPYDEIHIIAHSLGGIVARKAILTITKQENALRAPILTLHLADSPNDGLQLPAGLKLLFGFDCQAGEVLTTTGKNNVMRLEEEWRRNVDEPGIRMESAGLKILETYVYLPEESNFVPPLSARSIFDKVETIPGVDHWSLVKVNTKWKPDIYEKVKGKILWELGLKKPERPVVWVARFSNEVGAETTQEITGEIRSQVRSAHLEREVEIQQFNRVIQGETFEHQKKLASRVARRFRPSIVVWGAKLSGLEMKIDYNMLIEPDQQPGWRPDVMVVSPYHLEVPTEHLGTEVPRLTSVRKDIKAFVHLVLASAMTQAGRSRAAFQLLQDVELSSETSIADRLNVLLLRSATAIDAARFWEIGSDPCGKPYLLAARKAAANALALSNSQEGDAQAQRLILWMKFYDVFAQWVKPRENQDYLPSNLYEKLQDLYRHFDQSGETAGQGITALLMGSTPHSGQDSNETLRLWGIARQSIQDPVVRRMIDINIATHSIDDAASLGRLRAIAESLIDRGEFSEAALPLYNLGAKYYKLRRYKEALEVLLTPRVLDTVIQHPTSSLAAAYLLAASQLAFILHQDPGNPLSWAGIAKKSICTEEEPRRFAWSTSLAALAKAQAMTEPGESAKALLQALMKWPNSRRNFQEYDHGDWLLTLEMFTRAETLDSQSRTSTPKKTDLYDVLSKIRKQVRLIDNEAAIYVKEPDLRIAFETIRGTWQ